MSSALYLFSFLLQHLYPATATTRARRGWALYLIDRRRLPLTQKGEGVSSAPNSTSSTARRPRSTIKNL